MSETKKGSSSLASRLLISSRQAAATKYRVRGYGEIRNIDPGCARRTPMAVRNIYLKIERIADYSPVEPDDHVSPPIQYRRDCMRNMGHEDGTIPDDEVAARLTALI